MILALILSIGIGLSLSLLGGGGSIITVPVLVYAAGQSPQHAVPMSLAIVGAASGVGAALKARAGLVDWKVVLIFGATGVIGAWGGAQLTHHVSPAALLLIFACMMLIVALKMRFGAPASEERIADCRPLRCALAGIGVGAVTGFLGVGGGFLLVPALTIFARLSIKTAVGTSLVIIALNSLGGLAGHWKHVGLDWQLTGLFLVAALIGMAAGIPFAQRIAADALTRWFALFVAATAVFVIAENWRTIR